MCKKSIWFLTETNHLSSKMWKRLNETNSNRMKLYQMLGVNHKEPAGPQGGSCLSLQLQGDSLSSACIQTCSFLYFTAERWAGRIISNKKKGMEGEKTPSEWKEREKDLLSFHTRNIPSELFM